MSDQDERRKFIENTLDLWSRDPAMTTSKLIGWLYDDCRTACRMAMRENERLLRMELARANAEGFKVEVTDVTGDSAMMAENGRLKEELARLKEVVEEDIATWVLALTIIEEAERMSGHVPFAAVHNPIGRLHTTLASMKKRMA